MLSIVSLMLAVLLAAFTPVSQANPEKLVLTVDGDVGVWHAPLIVAAAQGFFNRHNIRLELKVPGQSDDIYRMMVEGDTDLVLTRQPTLHLHVNRNIPVKRIGTLIATPLDAVLTLADGPIATLADLQGRRVGYTGPNVPIVLRALLAKLKLEDVELVALKPPLGKALLDGRVDAVIDPTRSGERHRLALAGQETQQFYPEEYGLPLYDELVIAADRNRLDDPRLRRFMTALAEATGYLINHPDKSWTLLTGQYPELDTPLDRQLWQDLLPRFALRPAALDNNRYKRFAQFLFDHNMITVALPVSNYAIELIE